MVTIRMFFNWLVSATFRRARDMHKQVRKAINAQRDILTEKQLAAIREVKEELRQALRSSASKERLQELMTKVEDVANKNLHPYRHPSIRENVEVVLVAVAVAMAVRTFFLQPFKIPTGSMQPTLYGVTTDSLKGDDSEEIPHGWRRFYESWVYGASYYHVQARAPGRLQEVSPPRTIFPFVQKQTIRVGDEQYTIWFPPDTLNARRHASQGRQKNPFLRYYGLDSNTYFQPGDQVIKMKVTTGDYLFVDRLSYNFRRPERGEIIVFETKGIEGLPQNQFYIKRLIAKGGERVRIGNDRHVYINGNKLTAQTPGFEKVYSFDPSEPPEPSEYSGHVNGYIAAKFSRRYGPGSPIARLFPNAQTTYTVDKNHYMAMGDNTLNSKDSRNWGDFERNNVIGKFCFVYWPFSERWGP